jgi:FkbM family methyltransferase
MHPIPKRLAEAGVVRRALLPLFRLLNPGDITIRHHWTGERMVLHSFRHKGYWFYGRERERNSMSICAKLIRAGDVVFDVGGHIGYTALYFAKLSGRLGKTFAFEPSPLNLPYIRKNIKNAARENVVLVECAVGSREGLTTFWSEDLTGQNGSIIPNYCAVASTAKSHGIRAQTKELTLKVMSLDAFAAGLRVFPNFVKIDVEGAESLVLSGMRIVLAASRPRLMIEVTNEGESVFNTLTQADYVLFDEKQQRLSHFVRSLGAGPNLFAVHSKDMDGLERMKLPE